MITYELAKQLKDAGWVFPVGNWVEDKYLTLPTLSELIEACGEHFGQLKRYTNAWQVMDCYDLVVTGKTPEEAVAKLWLKLYGTKNT